MKDKVYKANDVAIRGNKVIIDPDIIWPAGETELRNATLTFSEIGLEITGDQVIWDCLLDREYCNIERFVDGCIISKKILWFDVKYVKRGWHRLKERKPYSKIIKNYEIVDLFYAEEVKQEHK